mmetsp:Transcript_46688/g.130221  ORF Transcript_46688/g.130221 Transcript_46688/m.130221 type:complete len:229 (+) Transcript_46688:919-1605(+)
MPPMILRFFSGSETPSSALRNLSDASCNERLMPCSPFNRSRTSGASLRRRHPLSTRMAWKRSPIARCMRTAATVESTPPDTAPMTWPSGPTVSRTAVMKRSARSFMFQSCGALQIPTTKFLRMSLPRGEWVTSGWNWRPNILRDRLAIAAFSQPEFVAPMQVNPSGRRVTLSPCDIHIWNSSSRPPSSASAPAAPSSESTRCTMALPNSRFSPGATSPPKVCVSSCMP